LEELILNTLVLQNWRWILATGHCISTGIEKKNAMLGQLECATAPLL
jgi:hypothetical protein